MLTHNKKPLLVLFLLLVTSLACYSDNSLGLFELTPAPPTATPLPVAPPELLRFQPYDLAWAPASVTEAAFRLDLTTVPEPLAPDLSNKSPQSCSQNSLLKILYSGVHEDGTVYLLVDCSGVVGWTLQDTLLGPIGLVVNDRALTTEAGVDSSGNFKIEASDPPYREDDPFRQMLDCKVNDTVDVIAMSGYSSGELYYKIRCSHPFNPVAQNIGWTTADNLFGPVRFRNGETGIVSRDAGSVSLTAEPDRGDVVATCQQDEILQITDTPVQRIDNDLFYEITCEEGTGWTNQNALVGPVPFAIGAQVLVTAPGVTNSAEARLAVEAQTPDETAENPDATNTTEVIADATATSPETEEIPAEPLTLPAVPITAEPEPLVSDNQVGECVDATVTQIQDYAGVGDVLYSQVECDGVVGWLDEARLYGTVEYQVGDTVMLGEKALIGFNQRGIFLSVELFDIEGPSGGSDVVAGECAINFETFDPVEATLTDVGYYRSSTGTIVGVFYRASCENENGDLIEGWINQDRIGA